MSAASEAYDRLHYAMQDTDPACLNDGRFILDDQPADSLKAICGECSLLDLCTEYARLARPAGGIWAGKRWTRGKYRPRKKPNTEAVA